jgi:alpha-1,6-mannosyltransferase
MLVFRPDGSIGLYTVAHVALATFAAVVAAFSLTRVDPLRLRGTPRHTADSTAERTAPVSPTLTADHE